MVQSSFYRSFSKARSAVVGVVLLVVQFSSLKAANVELTEPAQVPDKTLLKQSDIEEHLSYDSTDITTEHLDITNYDVQPELAKKGDVQKQEQSLYPGVSVEQNRLAEKMVHLIYSFDWDGAEQIALVMRELEKEEHLSPLSYLLLVSMKIFQIQNNEYPDEQARLELLKEVDELAPEGLRLSDVSSSPDSLLAINLLIHGGIKGFRATLKMERSLIQAARDGFGALRLLEQLVETEPSIKDGYLGLGLFYSSLSKAPGIVRAALSIGGRRISLSKGLDYLRKAAYGGQYTNSVAMLYLIQFLDPYYGHTSAEKCSLFATLQSRYPHNSYYVFLQLDEYLCFHRQKLSDFTLSEHYKDKIRNFKEFNHSTKKYSTLVKYQYRLINPYPPQDLEPNLKFDLREFEFYPVFLQAVREKILLSNQSEADSDYSSRREFIRKKGEKAQELLENSIMGPGRRGFYAWHIRDALNLR
ncbi:hypothetical protein QA601_04025 [Chitinispirillales bacterium ANBcel5]|uniref:hypothetical protein n=1 Tax=Cellulosispirillum alkaliphilum TaxID=3039283 RepID=UPI002A5043FE|nr:hypothetical protein [Chitinispirillales bacterium ANBcel5]